MEIVFMNRYQRNGMKSMKIFEEPVSFSQICSRLDPEHKGEEDLESWLFAGAVGDPSLTRTCFDGCMGLSVLELEQELNQVWVIFDEWGDEKLLSTLHQAAEQCGIPFYEFVLEDWRCVLHETDSDALRPEFEALDPSWKWAGIEGKVPLSDLREFVRTHPKQVIEVNGDYVILKQ